MSDQEVLSDGDVSVELQASDEAGAGETGSAREQLDDPTTSQLGRLLRRRRALVAAVLAVLIVAASAAGAWQYVTRYRSDIATDAREGAAAVVVARDGAVAILSYSPDTLEHDFASAKSRLTGDFLAYYNEFTEQVVRPAATEQKVKTTAEVTRAALSEISPTSAKALVFINQTTTSTAKPDPVLTASSVIVTMVKRGNDWLISGFDPL